MTEAETRSSWPPVLRIVVMTILLSVCAGFFVAFSEDDTPSQRAQMFAVGFGVLAAGLLFQSVRDVRAIMSKTEAMPSQERKASRMMLAMLAVGGAACAATVAMGDVGANGFPTVGSLNPIAAIALAAAIVIIGPWMTTRWWRATDEHERQAYIEGAYVSASVAVYAGTGWWLLSRAALVPPPDGFAIIIGISFIWSAVWLYRKYS